MDPSIESRPCPIVHRRFVERQWGAESRSKRVLQFGSVDPHLRGGESLTLTSSRIVFIVVIEAQEDKVVGNVVLAVSVEVCDLAALGAGITLQPIANATTTARLYQDSGLKMLAELGASHQSLAKRRLLPPTPSQWQIQRCQRPNRRHAK